MGYSQPRAVGSTLVRKGMTTKKVRKHKGRHERELGGVGMANKWKVLIVYKNNSLEFYFSADSIWKSKKKIERKGNKTEIRNDWSSHPPNITAVTWIQTPTGQSLCSMASSPSTADWAPAGALPMDSDMGKRLQKFKNSPSG